TPTNEGQFDGPTQEALRLYQRRHMLASAGILDADTRATLLTDTRELDFLTLLRALRERVADAAGLIEDGSASDAWEPVLGRFIEPSEYRHPLRSDALKDGAPDLIARATEAAARALGWTSPADATRVLARPGPGQVALRLPPVPTYHKGAMRLRIEIDRGDVWTSYPLDPEGHPRPSPAKNRPTMTVFALTDDGEIPLVRWPTTIGAWKPEKLEDGSESLRYKESPVGSVLWRDLIVAPSWFPPPTTPDRELMRRGPDGKWAPDRDGIGPGYRSAYGLVALVHHRQSDRARGGAVLVDLEIRTHGSGNYRSIMRGSSHGCHRLFNHLAIRLGSFLLAHHDNVRSGLTGGRYQRTITWRGRTYKLRASSRGYRYELTPPVPVEVLPGRTVRSKPAPTPVGDPTAAPAPSAPVAPPGVPRS
ncbi:MAG TPA: peptidoglycan-binding domain-containing protein, partial [Polyangia bacterium]|nr:peptidoglycan-binding domain-containing protein [Polyangia bacterium]